MFRDVAKLAYPLKTIEALGAAIEKSGRSASRSSIKYWLKDEHGPPAWVLAIVFAEIMRGLATRS